MGTCHWENPLGESQFSAGNYHFIEECKIMFSIWWCSTQVIKSYLWTTCKEILVGRVKIFKYIGLPIVSLPDKSQQLLSSKLTFLADIKQEEWTWLVFAATVSARLLNLLGLGSCFHNSKNVHFIQVIAAVGFMNQRLDLPGDLDPQWLSIIKSCWHRLFLHLITINPFFPFFCWPFSSAQWTEITTNLPRTCGKVQRHAKTTCDAVSLATCFSWRKCTTRRKSRLSREKWAWLIDDHQALFVQPHSSIQVVS